MRIKLRTDASEFIPIAKAMREQGDEVTFGETEDADIRLDLRKEVLALSAIQAAGLPTTNQEPDLALVRWVDKGVLHPQTLIALLFDRLMDDNIGPIAFTASASRYTEGSITDIFSCEALTKLMNAMAYKGPLTVLLKEATNEVTGVVIGIPFCLYYTLLEGVRGKISEFLMGPAHLIESWVVSLVMSTHPYPIKVKGSVDVGGISKAVERHFWMPHATSNKGHWTTPKGIVGYSCAWGLELHEANRRALTTCRHVQVEDKQYRTDVAYKARQRWGMLLERGLV